ncbi:hypothetical protein [Zongyangia hominis]|uniref:Uncharacterized protein n=1 Tax=Zongyangia hominis TaxID=2763677 RepID=A0A926ICE9_9FIRM|nr:hypothetical protein [Zongyangia hominis]MBC8571050.1 hypothetical protein [Zongyangia hominis]
MDEINEEIDKLFDESYNDFKEQLELTILSSYYNTIYNDKKYQTSVAEGLVRDFPELPVDMTNKNDPRDQYRIIQGVELYEKVHKKNS